MPPKGRLTGNWIDTYYVLQSSRIQNTKPFLGPVPHITDNLSPWSSEVTLLPSRDQAVTLGFWVTQLAQSDFAQEMKKVQGRLDPWGLRGTERKQLAETLHVPGARDKVPPELPGPCH